MKIIAKRSKSESPIKLFAPAQMGMPSGCYRLGKWRFVPVKNSAEKHYMWVPVSDKSYGWLENPRNDEWDEYDWEYDGPECDMTANEFHIINEFVNSGKF